MTSTPEPGTVLGRFDKVVERDAVWPVDWAVGLDEPEYQDPDVASSAGSPGIPVPPGALVFFSFLDDFGWMDVAGVVFERSLATRRRVRQRKPVHVGDRLEGEPSITEVTEREGRDGIPMRFVTISTVYRRDDEPVVEEEVTYATRGAP